MPSYTLLQDKPAGFCDNSTNSAKRARHALPDKRFVHAYKSFAHAYRSSVGAYKVSVGAYKVSVGACRSFVGAYGILAEDSKTFTTLRQSMKKVCAQTVAFRQQYVNKGIVPKK